MFSIILKIEKGRNNFFVNKRFIYCIMLSRNQIVIILLIFIIIIVLITTNKTKSENFQNEELNIKSFVINLDKDKKRYRNFIEQYNKNDISAYPVERYSAVVGKDVKQDDWLTDDTLQKLYTTEKRGYRTHHHDITRGGTGCFISHYNLSKRLINDSENDAYLIFEDDTTFLSDTYGKIQSALKKLPENWDIVLFYTIRAIGRKENNDFNKLKSFWGMNCYIINKKGAEKLIKEVEENKIDGQIDCYLSKMIQQGKINIYASSKQFIIMKGKDTNIQMRIKSIKGIDPYDYNGYKL